MNLDSKHLRYYYWISIAFFKKNFIAILLSSLATLVGVIILVTFSPYILKIATTKTQTIGLYGEYSANNLPDEILEKISNGLLHIDDKGEILTVLAQSYEISNNGQEFRFKLKKDLTWSSGKPFTSRDINYIFKDVKIETPDNESIVFSLKRPLSIFPHFLTRPIVNKGLEGVAGMYTIDRTKYSQGKLTSLILSPNRSGFPILIYKFYDTESKLVEAYKLAEIDEFVTSNQAIADEFVKWKNSIVEKSVDYERIMALFYNFNFQLLREEKDLRHAIAESVDKSAFDKLGEIALGPIPPINWAYDSTVMKAYPFNPNVSSKIISKYQEEASISAQIKLSTFYENLEVAESIKKSLASAGLPINIEVVSGDVKKDFQLFLAPMNIGRDPDQYFFWHSTQINSNLTAYKNFRIDKLLEDGRTTFGISKRTAIYSDFQRILVEDMPAHFLYYPYLYTVKRR